MKKLFLILVIICSIFVTIYAKEYNNITDYSTTIDSLKNKRYYLNKKIEKINITIDSLNKLKETEELKNFGQKPIIIKTIFDAKAKLKPDNHAKVYKKIFDGTELKAYGYVNGYWKINFEGETLYVSNIYIENNNLEKLKKQQVNKKLEKAYIIVNKANIRQFPNFDSKIINQLEFGDSVFVKERKNEWLNIFYKNKKNHFINNDCKDMDKGWIYLSLTNKKLDLKKYKLRAFGSINFLESLKEVNTKLETNGIRSKYPDKLEADSYFLRVRIGEYYYNIKFYFFKKILYKVKIESKEMTANYYSTYLKDYWKNLVKIISKNYGEVQGHFIPFMSMNSGYIKWSHIWKIKNKEIQIGIGESESKYYTILQITYSSIEDMIKKNKKENNKKEVEKAINMF